MTNDTFETTLRDLLHDATDAQAQAYLEPDPGLVLARGRRTVRRRRVAMVGGIAAATLVVGVGGAVVLSDEVGHRDGTVPAHSVTPTPVGAVTATMNELSMASGPDGTPGDITGPRRFAVTVDPTAPAGEDLRYWSVDDDGGRTLLAGSSLDGVGPLGATWGTGSATPHAIVGILPAAARQWTLVLPATDDDGGHAWTSATAALPGTSWQAFSALFDETSDAAGTSRLIWVDADGAVHDQAGATVPSTRMGPEHAVVYVDEESSTLGAVTTDNFVTTSTALPVGTPPVISAGREEDGTLSTLFAVVLPPGRTAPEVVPGTGHTLKWSDAQQLPGDAGTVVAARLEAPAGTRGSAVASVTVTEPGGTTKTYGDF